MRQLADAHLDDWSTNRRRFARDSSTIHRRKVDAGATATESDPSLRPLPYSLPAAPTHPSRAGMAAALTDSHEKNNQVRPPRPHVSKVAERDADRFMHAKRSRWALRNNPSRRQVSDHQTEGARPREPAVLRDFSEDALARLAILPVAEDGHEIGANNDTPASFRKRRFLAADPNDTRPYPSCRRPRASTLRS